MRLKACGIRRPDHLSLAEPDFLGLNCSPLSKRQIRRNRFRAAYIPPHTVGVFKGNDRQDIRRIIDLLGLKWVQLYAGEVTEKFLQELPTKIILAAAGTTTIDSAEFRRKAMHSDLIIIDGTVPGSGLAHDDAIAADFPFPFLLAGGLHLTNLSRVCGHPMCIGADVASGLETNGQFDPGKARAVRHALDSLADPKTTTPTSTSLLG
jgi:phosphoribosylanthranilate isomerase